KVELMRPLRQALFYASAPQGLGPAVDGNCGTTRVVLIPDFDIGEVVLDKQLDKQENGQERAGACQARWISASSDHQLQREANTRYTIMRPRSPPMSTSSLTASSRTPDTPTSTSASILPNGSILIARTPPSVSSSTTPSSRVRKPSAWSSRY